MASYPCTDDPSEIIEAVSGAGDNAEKFDKFVNGGVYEEVQLGTGQPTPTLRNTVHLVKSAAATLDGADVSGKFADAANGGTTLRTLSERFGDLVNPKDFGAEGDGSTSDTAAFAALEAAASGRMVDLCGASYVVSSVPTGNYYYNGSFIVGGETLPQNLPLASWDISDPMLLGIGHDRLNYCISNGAVTPEYIVSAFASNSDAFRDVIAIGNRAAWGGLQDGTTIADTVAIGSGVMSDGEMTDASIHNIGIGEFALHRVASGHRNIGIGSLSLVGLTSGIANIAIGRDCGQGITSGSYNVAVGYQSMGAYGWANVYGGIDGQTKITGSYNVAVGPYTANYLSGDSAENVFMGYNAALNSKLAHKNVAIGRSALFSPQCDTSINGKTVVAETISGTYSQTGTTITVTMAGHHAVAGCYVVIQFTSGDISGSYLEYVSSVSGNNFTIASSVSNTTSGNCSASIFEQAADSAQKSEENISIGYFSGVYLKSAENNVIVGANALRGVNGEDSTASNSVAVGYSALALCEDSDRATAVGFYAAGHAENVTKSVIIGDYAALNCDDTISNSVIIGSSAANYISSGHLGNVFIGTLAADMSGSMTNCTCVGYQSMYDTSDTNTYSGSTALGYNAKFTGDNQVQLGGYGSVPYAWAALQTRSDVRDKADVRNTRLGLDFILALRPVDFRWDCRDAYIDVVEDGIDEEGSPVFATVRHEKDGSRKRNRFHHGLIAQEVKAVLDEKGIDFGGYQDHKINGGRDVLTLGYEEFIAPIIKAIQEIDARIAALEA